MSVSLQYTLKGSRRGTGMAWRCVKKGMGRKNLRGRNAEMLVELFSVPTWSGQSLHNAGVEENISHLSTGGPLSTGPVGGCSIRENRNSIFWVSGFLGFSVSSPPFRRPCVEWLVVHPCAVTSHGASLGPAIGFTTIRPWCSFAVAALLTRSSKPFLNQGVIQRYGEWSSRDVGS